MLGKVPFYTAKSQLVYSRGLGMVSVLSFTARPKENTQIF
jgi:hypothetical protein